MRSSGVASRVIGTCQIDLPGGDVLVREDTLEHGKGSFGLVKRPTSE